MTIKTPHWAARAGAYPTEKGWTVDRSKGKTEVIKAAKFDAADIAEWHGSVAPEPQPAPQMLNEAPSIERTLTSEEVDHHYSEVDDAESLGVYDD